ncbi:MAG: hypothetical protein FWK04_21405 [Nostoc sp. GBBB01]|nr:hypothetical protein [Nostoc sp. GBBB01]
MGDGKGDKGDKGAGEQGSRGDEFFPSAPLHLRLFCPMPHALCPMPYALCIIPNFSRCRKIVINPIEQGH